MMETYFGNGDIDALAEYYRVNTAPDFVYLLEYTGATVHPMSNKGPVVYKGYDKILEIAGSFTLKMPDFIFKFTDINVEDNGNTVCARWECNGSKQSGNQPNVVSHVTVCGYVYFYLNEHGIMTKMHYIVHSNT